MGHFAVKRISALAASVLACTACVSTGTSGPQLSASELTFGDEFAVQATIGTIKSRGGQDLVGSRAIRLPEQPLGEITVFDYQYPPSCGSHEFRVFEAQGMQVLEFRLAASDGSTHMIRDFVTGSSPFVKPGLWSANDHTANSISTMTSQFETRGDRLFRGVYSQGLVTGLPDTQRHEFGSAYQQALIDVFHCQDAQTLARLTGE